jgi:4-amino-4-deoxy-L-arabinose transferase-like glycosyltransferase
MTGFETSERAMESKWSQGWIFPIVLGVAFAVRFYMVLHTYVITNDGILYVDSARLISMGDLGETYNRYLFNLYPFFIAVFQKALHNWEFSAQMVSAIFGTLTIIPFYLLVSRVFNRPLALLSSIVFACHPYLVRYSADAIREPTFWFFFMLALWVGWEATVRKRIWLCVLVSVLGVMSFFVRIEGILVLPVVALWVFFREPRALRASIGRRVVLLLVVLFSAPVLLSPIVVYLERRTGVQVWSKVGQIAAIGSVDLRMKEIKRNINRLDLASADPTMEDEERVRLYDFLMMAKDHRIGVVGLEMIGKFLKTLHPILFIVLAFGVIRRKEMDYRGAELYPLSFVVLSLLILLRGGTAFFYIGTRHMMVVAILSLLWVGAGLIEIEGRAMRGLYIPGGVV